MKKPKTTHQLRRATGLNRLGGANSLGSKKLADDTGSKSAARTDDALSSLSPDPRELAPTGSTRHYADADYAHGAKTRGKVDMLKTSVHQALQDRQFKGHF